MVNEYFNTAGYSCAMKSVWNPKDSYNISVCLCSLIEWLYVTQKLIIC